MKIKNLFWDVEHGDRFTVDGQAWEFWDLPGAQRVIRVVKDPGTLIVVDVPVTTRDAARCTLKSAKFTRTTVHEYHPSMELPDLVKDMLRRWQKESEDEFSKALAASNWARRQLGLDEQAARLFPYSPSGYMPSSFPRGEAIVGAMEPGQKATLKPETRTNITPEEADKRIKQDKQDALDALEAEYKRAGQDACCQLFDSKYRDLGTYRRCIPCEEDMPHINGICVVCGTPEVRNGKC